MAIVNGTYVPETLGNWKDAQRTVFGKYSKNDMSDMTTAAYNYLQKQQEQAYNLDLWNLTNQYNSPASQMQRFQDAGLNPNLIYNQQNTAQSPASASAGSFHPANVQTKRQANQIQMINTISSLAKNARDTYDYLKYGAPAADLRNKALQADLDIKAQDLLNRQEQGLGLQIANAWNQYLLSGEGGWQDPDTGVFHSYREGPKGSMYATQYQVQEKNFERMKFLVSSLMPSQVARNRALTELDKYQHEFMKGKYSGVLDLDLGLGDTVNQWAKMILFMSLAHMF